LSYEKEAKRLLFLGAARRCVPGDGSGAQRSKSFSEISAMGQKSLQRFSIMARHAIQHFFRREGEQVDRPGRIVKQHKK
jgi:hypothetical protein